jgi:hypothetical protein
LLPSCSHLPVLSPAFRRLLPGFARR